MVVSCDGKLSQEGDEYSLGRDGNMATVAGDTRHGGGSAVEKRRAANESPGAIAERDHGVGLFEAGSRLADESQPPAGAAVASSPRARSRSERLCECADMVFGQKRHSKAGPQQSRASGAVCD